MQVVGCGPFAAVVVFAGRRNTKSGAASPQLGETTPLVGIYSVVSGGPRSCLGSRPAALGAAGLGLSPPVHWSLQAARGDRKLRMFVVSGDHLLDVVVVVAAVTDLLSAADPVAGIGHGVSDWRVGLSPAPDCWIPADRYAMLEMAPLPIRAIPRKTKCAQGGVRQVQPARGEGALRPGSGDAAGNSGCGAGAGHSSARAGVGGNRVGGENPANAARPAVAWSGTRPGGTRGSNERPAVAEG